MSAADLEDLKQFIDDRFDVLVRKLTEHDERFDKLGNDMQDGFAGVGEAIDVIHAELDDVYVTIGTVDKRLCRLEHHLV